MSVSTSYPSPFTFFHQSYLYFCTLQHRNDHQSPKDTTPKVYVTSPWLDSLRMFLRQSQAKIRLPNIQTLHLLRTNDHPIMDNPNKNLFTKSELESINACQLLLQVTTMAEISNDSGTHLLNSAILGKVDNHQQPLLWTTSISKVNWPVQGYPPRQAWKQWKFFLLTYTTNSHRTLITARKLDAARSHTTSLVLYSPRNNYSP
jgi:hypothetical protein